MTSQNTSGERPAPVRRTPKTEVGQWLETALDLLVTKGITAVRIDRMATLLKVTRGGFYYHFKGREDLYDQLLALWRQRCAFIPTHLPLPAGHRSARAYLQAMLSHLIEEVDYNPKLDMAVRDWGRSNSRVRQLVAEEDARRMEHLEQVYSAYGHDSTEAKFRARVFYMHQIGYYALGMKEDTDQRLAVAALYLNVLSGDPPASPEDTSG